MSNIARVAGQAANTLSKPLNVEEVFSTYLYEGNWDGGAATTNQIVNGIDLSTEGGLVWIKNRGQSNLTHRLFDSETSSGVTGFYNLSSASTAAAGGPNTSMMSSFNSDGFTVGNNADVNSSYHAVTDYASWTFRKAPKFFDVVTYTGNSSTQTISHNLGSVPGCIIVKATSTTGNWVVYHRGTDATSPQNKALYLNLTNAASTSSIFWNNTAPTSSDFTVGNSSSVNISGQTYVAYLFAHNDGDGEFGPDGDADIIKCGSWTTAGTGSPEVNLGFEPQWIMFKRTDGTGDWRIYDTMRGWLGSDQASNAQWLKPNTSDAESTLSNSLYVTPTGFVSTGIGSGTDYIYIAIRRGPMAVPESGTDVFDVSLRTGTGSVPVSISTNFAPDMWMLPRRNSSSFGNYLETRITGFDEWLETNNTAGPALTWTSGTGPSMNNENIEITVQDNSVNQSGGTYVDYVWKRAPSFFDVVAYTGNGANRTINHNLGVAPEMMWVKRRDTSDDWAVYYGDPTDYLELNTTAATDDNSFFWNDTAPTETVFSLGANVGVNGSGSTYIAYLFASLDGVSKVGSYTGNGSSNGDSQNIDCGFSSGARFVLIKRTDASSNWLVFDSTRGIVAGNDPLLVLNLTNAEYTTTDEIDPYSAGFAVTVDLSGFATNVSGASYIFYAIA